MGTMLFAAEDSREPAGAMIGQFNALPQTHTLYFGPAECVRHTLSCLLEDDNSSVLIVNDVQLSLGLTEELVAEAVESVISTRPDVRAFVLCTGCQTRFLGIDFPALCASLHAKTGLCFAHVNASRMQTGGTARRAGGPGHDRFGARMAQFGMLAQCEGGGPAGVLVLGGIALNPYSDLNDYLLLEGIGWVRGTGGLASFDEFAQCRGAALCIVADDAWLEVAEYLQSEFDVPYLRLAPSYSLNEIAAQLAELDGYLSCYGTVEQWELVWQRRQQRRGRAVYALRYTLATCGPLELDVQLVARPYSLVEALLDYGFAICDVNMRRMGPPQFGGADDSQAQWRLRQRAPQLVEAAAGRGAGPGGPGGPGGGPGFGHGGTGFVLQRDRPSRFRNQVRPQLPMPTSDELAWCGYSGFMQLLWQLCCCAGSGNFAAAGRAGCDDRGISAGQAAATVPHSAMKGLWSVAAPPATDSNGACAVFSRARAFLVLHDVHGSATTLGYLLDMNQTRAIVSAVSLPELAYVSGDEDVFQDRIATMFQEACAFYGQEGRETPEFIVVLGAPASKLLGMDLQHRAQLLQQRLGVPALSVETSGCEPYDKGIAAAYEALCQLALAQGPAVAVPMRANIIGLTQMDWPDEGTVAQLLAGFEGEGLRLASDFGYSGGLEDWACMLTADRNIVVSAAGLRLARKLQREHGMPFACIHELDWFDAWAEGLSVAGCGRVLIVGEQLQSTLIRRLLHVMGATNVDCATFFTSDKALRCEGDAKLKSEGELVDMLKTGRYAFVICDASYAKLVPGGCTHIPLAHPAAHVGMAPDEVGPFTREWLCWAAGKLAGRG